MCELRSKMLLIIWPVDSSPMLTHMYSATYLLGCMQSESAQFAPREYKCWGGKTGEICRTGPIVRSLNRDGARTSARHHYNTVLGMPGCHSNYAGRGANLVHLTH